MILVRKVPTKLEEYSVAARPLTPDEIEILARKVVDEAGIWFDDKGAHPTFDSFLGMQIGLAILWGQLKGKEQIDQFVARCHELAS
jgi:hypothetical protein